MILKISKNELTKRDANSKSCQKGMISVKTRAFLEKIKLFQNEKKKHLQ